MEREERPLKLSVARNTVRAVLAGSDAKGKMVILRDVLADLRADGAYMDALLRQLEAGALRANVEVHPPASRLLIPASEPAVEGTRTVMNAVVDTVFASDGGRS